MTRVKRFGKVFLSFVLVPAAAVATALLMPVRIAHLVLMASAVIAALILTSVRRFQWAGAAATAALALFIVVGPAGKFERTVWKQPRVGLLNSPYIFPRDAAERAIASKEFGNDLMSAMKNDQDAIKKAITDSRGGVQPGKQQPQHEESAGTIFKRMLGRIAEMEKGQPSAQAPAEASLSPYGRSVIPPVPAPVPLAPFTAPATGERYGYWAESAPKLTSTDPLSTFSIDVDTASYSNARRFLTDGRLPPPESVRVEEFINYFDYNYPHQSERPFAVHYEIAPSPLDNGKHLLKIGIRARDAAVNTEQGWNLVFLVDVSGSMADSDKLPLVKEALKLVVEKMRPQDKLGIVTYSDSASVVLDSASGRDKSAIVSIIEQLSANGSTNGADGINRAYDLARTHFIRGAVNRVLLATDGDFNVGNYSFDGLMQLVEQQRRSGISLTTLGFGKGNINEKNMEQLADRGNGNYFYVDSYREARNVLDRSLQGTLQTVAKDVKLQIEFNPANVIEHRLIGYDNRTLANQDFKNDAVDAGEIGAGHTVTAIYELVLPGSAVAQQRALELRYAKAPEVPTPAGVLTPELGFVKIRYKAPDADESDELSFPMQTSEIRADSAQASQDFRFAASVAYFAQLLRHSQYIPAISLQEVANLARSSRGEDSEGLRAEFIRMVEDADAITRGVR